MKLLIPLILLLAGLGGGVGAGLALRPTSGSAAQAPQTDGPDGVDSGPAAMPDPVADNGAGPDNSDGGANLEYIKLNNQFVVPIVTKDSVESLIVMSLSLEVPAGHTETVYLREPKLRDVFLRVLFDHANMGGFRGTFTDTGKLASLRTSLLEVAQTTLGPAVVAVLITELTRQDM